MRLKGGEAVLAFDHAVEHGPKDYLGVDVSPKRISEIANELDGVMCHIGLMRRLKLSRRKARIVKLSANHRMSGKERQSIVTTVEEASEYADAVGFTLYFGTEYDHDMLRELAWLKLETKEYGLGLMVFAYPRGKLKKDWKSILYAVRLSQELGADYIKTYWPGKAQARKIMDYSLGPVYFAGGPVEEESKFRKFVRDASSLGAGLMIGRNVWTRGPEMARRVKEWQRSS